MLKAETEKAEQVLALNHSSVESRLREGKWWKSVMWLVGVVGRRMITGENGKGCS